MRRAKCVCNDNKSSYIASRLDTTFQPQIPAMPDKPVVRVISGGRLAHHCALVGSHPDPYDSAHHRASRCPPSAAFLLHILDGVQRCSSAHLSTATWPSRAAISQHDESHHVPRARARPNSLARPLKHRQVRPPSAAAAAAQQLASQGHPRARRSRSTSRRPARAAAAHLVGR